MKFYLMFSRQPRYLKNVIARGNDIGRGHLQQICDLQ
jgi:hypothetical protein